MMPNNRSQGSAERQIVLDTETTGLDPAAGHRIIEIGCVELLNRRPTGNHFHHYLQPDRDIEAEAVEVHGISSEFLADKPRFGDIVDAFLAYIQGAELIIHNAPFDVGFLNHELRLAGRRDAKIEGLCRICDTLQLARQRHPGQKNNLDVLCKRYEVDNTQRKLHGALLDAEILADVYLAMTREQVALNLAPELESEQLRRAYGQRQGRDARPPLPILRASVEERAAHERYLDGLEKSSGGKCVWRRVELEL